jgi:hypothetical protein
MTPCEANGLVDTLSISLRGSAWQQRESLLCWIRDYTSTLGYFHSWTQSILYARNPNYIPLYNIACARWKSKYIGTAEQPAKSCLNSTHQESSGIRGENTSVRFEKRFFVIHSRILKSQNHNHACAFCCWHPCFLSHWSPSRSCQRQRPQGSKWLH